MNHISTMIVEDERLILEDLLTIIDWEKEGFSVVATAINGKQGIQKFDKYHPQLIITDIKMPMLDGLDMIKSIKQFHSDVNFIVISSFSDFKFAQTALRLGAFDYILKTNISQKYILEKLNNIRISLTNQSEIYSTSYCKFLEDYISLKHLIQPEDLNTLFSKISSSELRIHFEDYKKQSIELISAAYSKLGLSPKPLEPILDIEDLKNWIYHELSFLYSTNLLYFEKKLSPVIINAYTYINDNFSNPYLRIQEIANAIGISPSRLSVLFRQEVGLTVNDVLTGRRIEEAKYLLRWKNLKVYEVSEKVGYKTSQYFSKVFYQYTGQYPNAYHESIES